MVKKVRILFLCLILILAASAMVACGDKDKEPQKLAFDTVLENTNNADTKTINSEFKMEFICYDPSGNPGKLTERFNLSRATNGTYYYAYGELKTDELTNILSTIINAGIGLVEQNFGADKADFEPIIKFVNGETYIAGQAGLLNDSINGQIVLTDEEDAPVFEFADDGSDVLDLAAAWGAIKYSDFLAFKDSLEVDSLNDVDPLEMLFSAFSLPIDWNAVTDSAKGTFINVANMKLAEYDLVCPADDIVALIKKTLEEYMLDIWGDDEEDYAFVKGYYDKYVDLVFEIFTVSDLHVIATVDSQNRLVTMDSDFSVKMVLTDEQVIGVLREEGVSEGNLKKVDAALSLVHMLLLGCSTMEEKKFEMEMRLSLGDVYSYGDVAIDTSSSVFTPFDSEDAPARITATWEQDEDGEWDWKFHLPKALEDYFNGDDEEDYIETEEEEE